MNMKNNTSNVLDLETEVTNYLKEGLTAGELMGLIGNNRGLEVFSVGYALGIIRNTEADLETKLALQLTLMECVEHISEILDTKD